jgi:hypothetical protein
MARAQTQTMREARSSQLQVCGLQETRAKAKLGPDTLESR